MTDPRYLIEWCAERRVWRVFRTGEFARFAGEFVSLAEAEEFVIREAPECEGCGR